MNYITEIPEGQAIICAGGVYRQVKIAERGGKIYAKYGAGFVRLHQGGGSTHTRVKWYEIDPGDGSYTEERGAVFYTPPAKVRAV